MRKLFLAIAFVLASITPSRVVAASGINDCASFRTWFQAQPGSRLLLSATNALNEKFAKPRKPDNILGYSPMPLSNDRTAWYKSMKHYRTNVGNGRCMSVFYDPVHETALVLSEYGTGSDLTITTVSSAPVGLPNQTVPSQTRNGVRLGMTLAQVQAIDGPGTLSKDGRYQRLMYGQNFKNAANAEITAYAGFLFLDGKLIAANVGGAV